MNTYTYTPRRGEPNSQYPLGQPSVPFTTSLPCMSSWHLVCPVLRTRGWYPPIHSTAHLRTRHGR